MPRRIRRFLLLTLAVVLFFAVHLRPVAGSDAYDVRALTYYLPNVCWDSGCTTYSGWSAYSIKGAAACGAAFPLWARLHFQGTDFTATCIDRGAAWHFSSTEVDLFVRDSSEGEWLMWYLWGRAVEVVWD